MPYPYEKFGCWDQGKSALTKLYLSKTEYNQPGVMGGVSQIELIITHFYTNPNFLLAIWKYLAHVCTGSENNVESTWPGVVYHQCNLKLQPPPPSAIDTKKFNIL